jgi:hypothetical protein
MTGIRSIPKPVRDLRDAILANARKAWGEDDIVAQDIAFVFSSPTGDRWEISDNYERFFSTIYYYYPQTDTWTTRKMYSDDEEQPYTFEKAMADARIMFTG